MSGSGSFCSRSCYFLRGNDGGPSLVMLIIAVPGGMLLNEWLKVAVHRQRPFVEGPFVDWSGYSFASGHTALRPACPFCAALTQDAPFEIALHFQRFGAGSPGRIHPHRVGRSFSD